MIAGLQKMTLLDFPGKVACTAFLQGCNFRCPYCHNSDLLDGKAPQLMDKETFLSFLEKRTGLLDAVCVSGGEPTLNPELESLLAGIKGMGYAVKLDTNGTRPEVLKHLVQAGLVDYVAMDVKNAPSRYGQTVGVPNMNLQPVEESLRFLLSGQVAYELRTTVVAELHDEASVLEMGQWLVSLCPPKKPEKLFLQQFTDRESVLFAGLHAPTPEQLSKYADILAHLVGDCTIRGV